MRIGRRRIVEVLSLVCLLGGTATALAPFGPPRATIGAGKLALGFDYSYQTMDLQSFGTYREGYGLDSYLWYTKYNQFEIKDLKSNIIFGRLGYGIGDTWEIFARVGVSDAKGDLTVSSVGTDGPASTDFFQGGERFAIDSSFALAWGAGSRMTFAETGDVAWGTIIQFTWLDPGASDSVWTDPLDPDIGINATIDPQYWELELAAGPTLNLGKIWLYGGPFVHFAKGTIDVEGAWSDTGSTGPIEAHHDLRDESNFGGFGGVQLNAAEDLCIYLEGQFTGGGWGVGIGGAWRLN